MMKKQRGIFRHYAECRNVLAMVGAAVGIWMGAVGTGWGEEGEGDGYYGILNSNSALIDSISNESGTLTGTSRHNLYWGLWSMLSGRLTGRWWSRPVGRSWERLALWRRTPTRSLMRRSMCRFLTQTDAKPVLAVLTTTFPLWVPRSTTLSRPS